MGSCPQQDAQVPLQPFRRNQGCRSGYPHRDEARADPPGRVQGQLREGCEESHQRDVVSGVEVDELQHKFADSIGKMDLDTLDVDFIEDMMLKAKPLQSVLNVIRKKQIEKLEEVKKSYGEAIKDLDGMKVTRPEKPEEKPAAPAAAPAPAPEAAKA